MLSWMYWTIPVAIAFTLVFLMITGMTIIIIPTHRQIIPLVRNRY